MVGMLLKIKSLPVEAMEKMFWVKYQPETHALLAYS
jgi:hypothetical protein